MQSNNTEQSNHQYSRNYKPATGFLSAMSNATAHEKATACFFKNLV
jgi:hypothetical protein